MATGMVLTVAQTLFAALQCKELREICSMFGYKTQLEELQNTATTIRAVLLDADSKQEEELSHAARDWIGKLKDAVYDVDDLLDEFNTIIQRKLQMQMDDGGKLKSFSKKVRRFFTRFKKLIDAYNVCLEIKKIKQKLDAITSDHTKFGFSVNYVPIRKTRKETWSYVNDGRIIGREGDKEAVVDLLLQDSSNVQEDVSFVTIVGMGGLGKTALAQLVYGDDRIESAFQLRLWVCVSEEFGVTEILTKMLMSAMGQKFDELGMDQLQIKVREKIEGKKFLLVLDDVWSESRNEWVDLKDFLIRGGRGSRILTTTRSRLVARAIGNDPSYDLKGLSPQDSWCLFVKMAFENGEEQADANLVEIGKEIVKKCSNVPLSIRVVGSLLFGQEKSRWKLFQEVKLSNVKHEEEGVMSILKFSYNQLSPSLKSCFSYCALFPKDYAMQKDKLIDLWEALGFIEPLYVGQGTYDAGEEHFSILLNRCFFQDIKKDDTGEVFTCKIHDLMHDLAQEVAGNETLILPSAGPFNEKLYHLSICKRRSDLFTTRDSLAKMKIVRTFLQIQNPWVYSKLVCQSAILPILSNCRCLRVLDLSRCLGKDLPSIVGELIHLRYLDVSHNDNLEVLPASITKLHNLQLLSLSYCGSLRMLPKNLSKLVNLRQLYLDMCDQLTHMPAGMDRLTCLRRLSMFVVGEPNSKQAQTGQLEDLKALVNLGGDLNIKVAKLFSIEAYKFRKGGYLLSKLHLRKLHIQFPWRDGNEDVEEALLESFRPNDDLRELGISWYEGLRFPGWATENNLRVYLPCLIEITLDGLSRMQHLPSMSGLAHLKKLLLWRIPNVEYIEDVDINKSTFTFFPSLEFLWIYRMQNLKGWWRRDSMRIDEEAWSHQQGNDGTRIRGEAVSVLFPRLQQLALSDCPNLASLPPCPHVWSLKLIKMNEELSLSEKMSVNPVGTTSNWDSSNLFNLITLDVDRVGYMKCLPEESTRRLFTLGISECEEESLSPLEQVFQSRASSVPRLEIYNCKRLKSVGRGVVEHLTNLHYLVFMMCHNLGFEDDDGMSWNSLHNLTTLYFRELPKMVNLSKGIQHLTALEILSIEKCQNLTSLPECLSCLTSLRNLMIRECPKLQSLPEQIRNLPSLTELQILGCPQLSERCRKPNGEDWPNICHIPSLDIE